MSTELKVVPKDLENTRPEAGTVCMTAPKAEPTEAEAVKAFGSGAYEAVAQLESVDATGARRLRVLVTEKVKELVTQTLRPASLVDAFNVLESATRLQDEALHGFARAQVSGTDDEKAQAASTLDFRTKQVEHCQQVVRDELAAARHAWNSRRVVRQ